VALRDRATDLGAAPQGGRANADPLRPWLRASEYKPLDGIVADTSRKIVREAGATISTKFSEQPQIKEWLGGKGNAAPVTVGPQAAVGGPSAAESSAAPLE
jgi:hypothetical protein